LVRNLFFVYALFAELLTHLLQRSVVCLVDSIQGYKSVFHCPFYERHLSPCLAFRLAILVKVIPVVMVGTFVNSVFVYDDKLVLANNYKDGTETLSLQEIESAISSNLTSMCPPKKTDQPTGWLFYVFIWH